MTLIRSPVYLPLILLATNDNDTSVCGIKVRLSANIRILIMSHSYHNLLPQEDKKVNYHITCPLLLLLLEHQVHVPPTVNSVFLQDLLTYIILVIRVKDIRALLPTINNVLASLTDVRFFLIFPSQTTPIDKSIPVSVVT